MSCLYLMSYCWTTRKPSPMKFSIAYWLGATPLGAWSVRLASVTAVRWKATPEPGTC